MAFVSLIVTAFAGTFQGSNVDSLLALAGITPASAGRPHNRKVETREDDAHNGESNPVWNILSSCSCNRKSTTEPATVNLYRSGPLSTGDSALDGSFLSIEEYPHYSQTSKHRQKHVQ